MHEVPLLMLELVRGGSASPPKKIPGLHLPFPPPPGSSLSLFTRKPHSGSCQPSRLRDRGLSHRGKAGEPGICRQVLAAPSQGQCCQGQAGSHRPLELSCLFQECQGAGLGSPCSSGQVRNISCCQKDGQKEVAFPFAKCVGNVIQSQEDSAAVWGSCSQPVQEDAV